MDFQTAFDRVNRKALLCKLLHVGVGGKFYSLVKDMYTDNQTCVKVGKGKGKR